MRALGSRTTGVQASGARPAFCGHGARNAVEQLNQPWLELASDLLSWPTHAALISLANYQPCQRNASRSASASEADGSDQARQVV